MVVQGGEIVIDSRSEVELLQRVFRDYLKHGNTTEEERLKLSSISGQLDALWYSW